MENSIRQGADPPENDTHGKGSRRVQHIGINKIDSMLRSPNCPFVLFVGSKKLVKRKEFEQYMQSGSRDLTLHLKNSRRSLEEKSTMRYTI